MLLCHLTIMQLILVLIEEAQVGVMGAITALVTTILILLGGTLVLEIDQICFVNIANKLDMSKTVATNSMVTQPTQEIQEEEAKDLQQMYILLKVMEVNVKRILSRETSTSESVKGPI